MLFNSFHFFVFFPVVTAVYFLLPHRLRWAWLLVASCYFYMAFIPIYILILFFTIGVDYVSGIAIESATGRKRKLYLTCSILANVGVLAMFKYFNFLNNNISAFFHGLGWSYPVPNLSLLLPIGLSFHTFQSLSYTIEVYRGRHAAERHLGIFALYVMFYPQLVAGPIERPQNLLDQFRAEHVFDYRRVTDGLKLMAWGFFKKLVIADRLAVVANQVYANPEAYDGVALLTGTLCFTYQIYCDFSGYSDIAIGSAQVMGFKLMTNFAQPYFSASIPEFWRRWHISLSTWFRDYLYIPIGGNRVPRWRLVLNIMVVFAVSGMWHGANWTFFLWGAIHGICLLLTPLVGSAFLKVERAARLDRVRWAGQGLRILTTFSVVAFAWIFFRANTPEDAFMIVMRIFQTLPPIGQGWYDAIRNGIASVDLPVIVPAIAAIMIMEVMQVFQRRGSVRQWFAGRPVWFRWAAYYAVVGSILIFGQFGAQQFIYFQF